MVFGVGSRIIVTTRSKQSARIIGNGRSFTYELGGLSDENSWSLFELTAFGKGCEYVDQAELVKIGKNIVKQCSNVPLAIKVVGSLLFGQDKSKWRAFEEDWLACLANSSQEGNKIVSILKMSYDSLSSPQKSCFSYCAIFPKGFRIRKEMLIRLWMSQGYPKPFYDGQNIEDAANAEFLVLLRRCFFQDVKMDEYGDVKSFKIHDLMHDVAQEVAGKEICVVSSMKNNIGGGKLRHVYEDKEYCEKEIFVKSKIRTYLQVTQDGSLINPHWKCMLNLVIENWVCLRSLALHHSSEKRLPDVIGNLLHLRNLDLNGCQELNSLPNSITKLHNLQTLILAGCGGLKELPKDLSKLVNIRHLDIKGCNALTYMPPGLHKLRFLTVLTTFYVAMSNLREKQHVGHLRDLKDLNNLKGGIEIVILEHYPSVEEINQSNNMFANMEHLNSVQISFRNNPWFYDPFNLEEIMKQEPLIETLQPHRNLKGLELQGYRGQIIPRWGEAEHNWANFLPYLVKIRIHHCPNLCELPLLSELEHLKSLDLSVLFNVEYLVESVSNGASFFPSLEYLRLSCSGLKGLIYAEDDEIPSFPRLSKLKIIHCSSLISFPSCPTVELLELNGVDKRLNLINLNPGVGEIRVDNITDLRALPSSCLPSKLSITGVSTETFSEASDVFKTRGSTSIRHIQMKHCLKLRSLSGGGFQHLTALESLEISYCPELSLSEDDVPWSSLHHSLVSIKLNNLNNLEILPRAMQVLSSLRHLTIECCNNFRTLPEWIGCLSALQLLAVRCCGEIISLPEGLQSLTSLRRLEINPCSPELRERCVPGGADWLKIKHISDLSIYSWDTESLFKEAARGLNPLELYGIEDFSDDECLEFY